MLIQFHLDVQGLCVPRVPILLPHGDGINHDADMPNEIKEGMSGSAWLHYLQTPCFTLYRISTQYITFHLNYNQLHMYNDMEHQTVLL